MLVASCLAGCDVAYEPALSDYAVMPAYSAAVVERAVLNRDLKVEVYGNPFNISPIAFAGQVAAQMNQTSVVQTHFTTHLGDSALPPYRFVWDFAPPRTSIAPNAVCKVQHTDPEKIGGGPPIDAYAAFCEGDAALTSGRVKLYYTETQNSIQFMTLVASMTAKLFPDRSTAISPIRRGSSRRATTQTGRQIAEDVVGILKKSLLQFSRAASDASRQFRPTPLRRPGVSP
jgi:hypothetical protein